MRWHLLGCKQCVCGYSVFFINKYIDRTDIDELIAKNVAKLEKKKKNME